MGHVEDTLWHTRKKFISMNIIMKKCNKNVPSSLWLWYDEKIFICIIYMLNKLVFSIIKEICRFCKE